MVESFQFKDTEVKEHCSANGDMTSSGVSAGPDPLGEIMVRLDQLLATLGSNSTLERTIKKPEPCESASHPARHTREPMPDPRMIREIIRARQMRLRFFNEDLFADPAWDMLLDLTAAKAEHRRVSITSLCIASGVPTTTALRWIKLLEHSGLVQRIEDETDRRRAFVSLTDRGADAMARYFKGFGSGFCPGVA